jgi:hypothetical protein
MIAGASPRPYHYPKYSFKKTDFRIRLYSFKLFNHMKKSSFL